MIFLPNLLLVSGSNRNVGKTTLICKVIEKVSDYQDIVGVKITPHFHNSRINKRVIISKPDLFIAEELDTKSEKDSSKMLRAGATKVLYIEAKDSAYQEIAIFLKKYYSEEIIVCESASLRKFIKPGIMCIVTSDKKDMKPIVTEIKEHIDIWFDNSDDTFDFDISKISFENNKWFF